RRARRDNSLGTGHQRRSAPGLRSGHSPAVRGPLGEKRGGGSCQIVVENVVSSSSSQLDWANGCRRTEYTQMANRIVAVASLKPVVEGSTQVALFLPEVQSLAGRASRRIWSVLMALGETLHWACKIGNI